MKRKLERSFMVARLSRNLHHRAEEKFYCDLATPRDEDLRNRPLYRLIFLKFKKGIDIDF